MTTSNPRSTACLLFLAVYVVSLLKFHCLTPSISHDDAADRLLSLVPQDYHGKNELSLSHLKDESHVPIPRRQDGTVMSVEERLRYLELKFNAHANFGVTDPFVGSKKNEAVCKVKSLLMEFGCREGWENVHASSNHRCPGLFDHQLCLDELPKPAIQAEGDITPPMPKVQDTPPCLVYDFGIREQPQFGAVMARTFGCEVHAFDPSPVSTKWWDSEKADNLRKLPNYHFHKYGAGGLDGMISLNQYNWGQMSIMKYPTRIVDCENKTRANCESKPGPIQQGTMPLAVKTLPTIIRELGHEGRTIDVMKVDVEGSEFAFLENMLDLQGGCPNYIRQLTLEWHHFAWDARYGEGSSPPINAIVTLLRACGLLMFDIYLPGGFPSTERAYHEMGLKDMRYNVASFKRKPK